MPATTTGGCGGCLRTATRFIVSATRIQSRFRGARRAAACATSAGAARPRGFARHGVQRRRLRATRMARQATTASSAVSTAARRASLRRDSRVLPTIVPPPPRRWDPEALSAVDMRLHWFAHVLARRATDLPRRMAELHARRLRAMLRVWASPSFDTWCRVAASRRRQRTALSLGAPRLAPRPFAGGRHALAPLSAAARHVAAAAAAHAAHGAAARAARAARCVAREWRGGRALVRCALARPAVWRGGALRTRSPHVARARAAAAISARRGCARRARHPDRAHPPRHASRLRRLVGPRGRAAGDARRARAAASRTATLALLRATLSWERYRRARRDLARRGADAAALVRLLWLRRSWQAWRGEARGAQCVRAESRGDGGGAAAAAAARGVGALD